MLLFFMREEMQVPRNRNTTWMAMTVGRDLAVMVARAIEDRRMTISDAIASGLARWLEDVGEVELANMLEDGRGTMPRYPLRHSPLVIRDHDPVDDCIAVVAWRGKSSVSSDGA